MKIAARKSKALENLYNIAEGLWTEITGSAHIDAYEIDSIFDKLTAELGLIVRTSKDPDIRSANPRVILISALNRLFARRQLTFACGRYVEIKVSEQPLKAAPRL